MFHLIHGIVVEQSVIPVADVNNHWTRQSLLPATNMSFKDRAISLLGQGYSDSVVAAAIGVTPGYISQLLEDPAVFNEVSKLRANRLEAAGKIDIKIETLEGRALQLVEEKMPFVRSPMEAVKIFATLNNAKKKTGENGAVQDGGSIQTVNITLPKALEHGGSINIQLNNSNQVIAVEGRSMAPLPSKALATLRAVEVIEDVAVRNVAAAPITEADIREVSAKQQAKRDIARAARILESVSTPITITIDGVECVL